MRRRELDNLRTFITMLVIVFHTAMTFGPVEGWYFYEPHDKLVVRGIIYFFIAVSQAWFMSLLFFLAGLFTPASYEKRKLSKFLKEKLLRLGIPFMIYVLLIIPVIQHRYLWSFEGYTGDIFAYYKEILENRSFIGSGPMWFALVLLLLSGGYAVYRSLQPKWLVADEKQLFPKKHRIFLPALSLGLLFFVVRIFFPINLWLDLFGISFLDLSHMPAYILFFVLGVMDSRARWTEEIPKKQGKLWLAIFVVLVGIWPAIIFSGLTPEGSLDAFFGGVTWQSLLYSIWEALVAFSAMIGLVWFFARHLNKQNSLLDEMAGASFMVYIIHTPFLVLVGYLMENVRMYPLIKWPLESIISIIVCFSFGIGIRRLLLVLKRPKMK